MNHTFPLTPYHAKYFAYELTKRYNANNLQKFITSLSDAQVDLNPHQVDAALFAFKSPLSHGAILADEVGLGKTIEAGIVISQKWAERKRSILIIAPANLRKQWSQELQDKFFLPSIILEAKTYKQEIESGNHTPFLQRENIVLCSYQYVRSKQDQIREVAWDLVVIDEAHRLRNVYKSSNKIARAIKDAVGIRDKILLTATPLQNSLLELYGLVSIIDDYTFGDLKSFKTQFARLGAGDNFKELQDRLHPICKRTLRRQVMGYIKYTQRICILQEFTPYDDETKLYEEVSAYLQQETLYALPSGQRKLMTLILRKLLASSTYAISNTLHGLANKLGNVLDTQSAQLSEIEGLIEVEYDNYADEKDEWIEEDEAADPQEKDYYSDDEIKDIKSEINDLNRFNELANSIGKNSKGEALLTALAKGFEKLQELGADRKAIIFTESTRTQTYLKNTLEEAGYAGQVVLFNGSNNDPLSNAIYKEWHQKYKDTDRVTGSKTADKRAALVDYFRNTAIIMIATEAAAEGINLQFCSLVVNYDLPWNPQRIEQRIGRCHRYGQKFDVVVINFLNQNNAADQRVYQLLDSKFKLFNGVFGASDEVLGAIESGIDFEKRILNIYQNYRSPAEIQEAFDALQMEMEGTIEKEFDNTRKKLLENLDEEVTEKLRINLRDSKEYLNKFEERLWQVTQFALQGNASFDNDRHSFFLNANPFGGKQIHNGPYRVRQKHVGESHEVNEPDDGANLYRVGHPLAQHVIEICKNRELPVCEIIFDHTGTDKIVSIIEQLKGTQGWLQAVQFSVTAFDTEDHILFAAYTNEGTVLDKDQCERLFSLNAQITDTAIDITENEQLPFDQIFEASAQDILANNERQNNLFFDEEVNKLEKWSTDVRNSVKYEIQELDKEIKSRKTEARKLLNLEQKVKEQRGIKELEKRLADKRLDQYKKEDEIEHEKDDLLNKVELRLHQQTTQETLFTIKWKVI